MQILEGISEEDTVVTSGQFLIDSESNLRETVNKMLEASAGTSSDEDLSKEADKTIFMPGPLSAGHHQLADNCGTCLSRPHGPKPPVKEDARC